MDAAKVELLAAFLGPLGEEAGSVFFGHLLDLGSLIAWDGLESLDHDIAFESLFDLVDGLVGLFDRSGREEGGIVADLRRGGEERAVRCEECEQRKCEEGESDSLVHVRYLQGAFLKRIVRPEVIVGWR